MATPHLSRALPRAWRACATVVKPGVARSTAVRWCSTASTGGGSAAQATARAVVDTAPRAAPKPRRRLRLRRVALALAGLSVAGAGGVAVWAQYDEGIQRTLKFWGIAMPIYMHYRWVQWQAHNLGWTEEQEEAAYEELHNRYAPVAEKLVLDMKGMYLKNAQLVSTRDEFLPPQYMAFCKRTQDQVPSEFQPGEVRGIVEKELGRPIDEVFEWFDDEVYGAASIGEVHRARLIGGQEVVVKVQYPDIERKFRSDMETIITFSKLAQPQHVKPLEEIQEQFMTEFDYRGEARNLKEIADNIMPLFGKEVYIPQPHMDLCTTTVMVMDFVPGKRLIDGIMDQHRRYAAMMGTTLEKLQEEHKAKLESGELQLKTLEEESESTKQAQRMIKLMDMGKNSLRFMYNWTVGWVATPKEYKHSEEPINLGYVMSLLNQVHAHEIMVDGAFNGDPHPGNILLLPDGRLGLIDYGQVKRIDQAARLNLARLVVALAKGDPDDVLDVYINRVGVRTKYMKRDILHRLACFWYDRDTDDVTGGRNIQTFMDWAQAEDPMDEAPKDYIMAARVSVMMRGMANAFGMRMRTAPLWLPVAEQALKDAGVDISECTRHRDARLAAEREREEAVAASAARDAESQRGKSGGSRALLA